MSPATQTGGGLLPLTASQHLIWAGQRLQPDDPLYNMILAFRIRGALDVPSFQQAFSALVAGCDTLRTIIVEHGDEPMQRVLERMDCGCECIDLSSRPDPEEALSAWLAEHRVIRFDLGVRHFEAVLLKLGEEEFVWYLNQHHILTDATSVAILFDRLQALYALARTGRLSEASALPLFQDYVAFERTQRTTRAHERARAFWRDRLATSFKPSKFYAPTPSNCGGRTVRLPLALGRARSERLRALALAPEFRAFTTDLALFQLFATTLLAYLHRIGGREDLALGTPSHNRAAARFRETAGLLIEIFPLQVRVRPDDTFATLYRKVAHATQSLLLNAPPGASSIAHLRAFDVVLNFINARFGEFDGLPVRSEWIHSGFGDRNHLMRMQVQDFDRSGAIVVFFDLNEDAFAPNERAWVPAHWLAVADRLCEDPSARVTDVELVSPEERRRLVAGFRPGRGTVDVPGETVVAMFERRARAEPEAVAVREEERTWRYGELDQAGNRLARSLLVSGVGSGSVVGLYVERSVEAVVAMLAILKCGAAYVPLDLDHPPERVSFMVRDAGARVVLAGPGLGERIAAGEARIVEVEEGGNSLAGIARGREATAVAGARADALAYVIYTSGSTGKPKGVAVTHRSLANYVAWAGRRYVNGDIVAFPLFSSLAFDLTVTSIFVPLVTGGQIVVYRGRGEGDGLLIRRVVRDDLVDVVKLTPAHLSLLQGMDLAGSRIRRLILGGEDLKVDLARTIHRRFGGEIEIFNEYGPTEATVGCMTHRFDPERDRGGSVPIGRAIDHLDVYLLDAGLRLVPPGVTGEICIGGAGVAEGYLNQAELTARKFIDNPFRPGEKMYASGDLAMWNGDGAMIYQGRADHQVKIRGVRVEIGEVEAALLAHPAVAGCVVAASARSKAIASSEEAAHCIRCGLPGNHPDAHLDAGGVCHLCRVYAEEQAQALAYFRTMPDLERIVSTIRSPTPGAQDCIMLLSGGKDSTYALCRLVDLGLTPLVFTLDNGFISEGAKANIRRVVDRLGLELVMGATPAMNAIFVDSLQRFSNVCNGCFKTIYTLSMKLANERGLRTIFTGLSRGQIFETRVAGLFQQRVFDADLIDRTIIAARKAYHRMDDAVSRLLDVRLFERDEIFEEITFLDFYRYCDVTLDEILAYLAEHVPWIRPADTGRSTNCLINNAGIFVHRRERGYHNYALPYSWDVRLGHKERNAALAELDDAIDEDKVRRILTEIGYTGEPASAGAPEQRALTAWYVARSEVSTADLKAWLRRSLPEEFVPSHFMALEALPLTPNGKVDREALPMPGMSRPALASGYVAPRNPIEEKLARIWSDILGVERVGLDDDFFELGGDSILSIQIVARAKKLGIAITPEQVFEHSTISRLARVATSGLLIEAEQGAVTGEVLLTPVQRQFFEQQSPRPDHANQVVWLETNATVDLAALRSAARAVMEHHDVLRSRFVRGGGSWTQVIAGADEASVRVDEFDVSCAPSGGQHGTIDAYAAELQTQFDLAAGGLFGIACFRRGGARADLLLLYAHHLVIDGVSWWPLLEDLETAYQQALRQEQTMLPQKTTSYRRWAERLAEYTRQPATGTSAAHWLADRDVGGDIPLDFDANGIANLRAGARTVCTSLDAAQTARLLQDVPGAYSVRAPDVLLTAALLALAEWAGRSAFRIDVEGHGREPVGEGISLLRTVGWFTSVFPFTVRLPAELEIGAALLEVKERFSGIPRRGVDFGALRYLGPGETSRALAALPPACVLFNYLGQWDQALATSALFQFARPIETSFDPAAPRAHLLEINALVDRGRLRVDWTYSIHHHREQTVRSLAERALGTLARLIEHCMKSRGGGLTAADFPAAGIGQSELEEVLAEFGKSRP